jgi:3-oxoadipate enol-lactonase
VRLGYELAGPEDAPVLVLSHSVGLSRAAWDAQLPVLAERFRVLRHDHRGHGESEAPPGPYTVEELASDLLDLLDRLGIERVSLCGLSLGGAVGLWLGSRAPERLERLVVVCSAARFMPHELWGERARIVRGGGLAGIAPAVAAKWFTPRFREQRPEVLARFQALLESVPPEGYASACEALGAWDFRTELGTVTVPTLVIAAEDDVNTPPADGAAIADGVAGARLVVIPGAAHLVNVEQPALFTEALLAHLEAA